jgi:hypothetical protein
MRRALTYSAVTLIGTALLGTALIGCEGEETAQYPPQPMPTQPMPMPMPMQTAAPQPTAGLATVLPPASGMLVAPILQGTAEKETSGMSADGPATVASFMAGQIHEQDFTIQPGRCYTIVGVGAGVHELDIVVEINQPPAPATPIAQDDRTGPQSVVGGAGNCHRTASPIPVPVKIRTTATAGSGIVMVQVYSK